MKKGRGERWKRREEAEEENKVGKRRRGRETVDEKTKERERENKWG